MKKVTYQLQRLNKNTWTWECINKPICIISLDAFEALGKYTADIYRFVCYYKRNNRTCCNLIIEDNKISVNTGKPSDASCLSWSYPFSFDGLKTAQETACEYANMIFATVCGY